MTGAQVWHWTVAVTISAIVLLVGTCGAVEVTLKYSRDDLAFSKINGYDYVELKGDRCSCTAEPGDPCLPVQTIHLLIPEGKRASGITVNVIQHVGLDEEVTIYPAQPPVLLSDPGPHSFTPPNKEVYESPLPFPEEVATLSGTAIIRGFSVAMVQVRPLVYFPASDTLILRTRIKIVVSVEDDPSQERVTYEAHDPSFVDFVRDDVRNPGDLGLFYDIPAVPYNPPPDPNDVKYLLIGDPDTFDKFGPLISWKTKKGVPAEAVSVDWIYANYSGADQQEEIKACIKDYVENKGTVWVVLAGDDTIVPDRDCSVDVGGYDPDRLPTDLYYACLDDMDWDDDGDGLAGEPGEDTFELGPDVYIGRLPIRNDDHAQAIVDKTLYSEKYCGASAGFAEKMLLCGVAAHNPHDMNWNSEMMYETWIDPYWGGPERMWFYDDSTGFPGGPDYDVTPEHLTEQFEAGWHFFHLGTHGSQTSWGLENETSYTTDDVSQLQNLGLYMNILTVACFTNAFDQNEVVPDDPCLSEALIRQPSAGAVTYIGHSREGVANLDPRIHGPSFRYDRMFYKFLLTDDSFERYRVGVAFAKMKECWSATSISTEGDSTEMRWCQFGINLMGDPELPLYTADPEPITPLYEEAIPVGSQTFVVETGISGAKAKVCFMKKEGVVYEVYKYGYADDVGHFEAVINPTTEGTMHVTVTAPNRLPHEGTVGVLLSSDGAVFFDKGYYNDADTVRVTVADLDLAGNGTQQVQLDTSQNQDYEVLTLQETGPATGVFDATIPTNGLPVTVTDGVLQVGDGETITARYIDLDDGQGGTNIEKTDTAGVDTAPPVFAGIAAVRPGDKKVVVSWEAATDDRTPIVYRVYRAESSGGQDFDEPVGSTTELFYVDEDVTSETAYFYVVRAEDVAGNEDDNTVELGATPRSPARAYFFSLDMDPGWTCEGQWALGAPSGQDGDPSEGYSGVYVYGYNLDGEYANNLPPTYLTTTALDFRGVTYAELRFHRWLGVEYCDIASVEVSTNGTEWTVVWQSGCKINDSGWQLRAYDISAIADNAETVYIRWGISSDAEGTNFGWNIDDIEIRGTLADTDQDGLPDHWEYYYFDHLGEGPDGDYDSDGASNLEEYVHGTDPTNTSTDGDLLSDGEEISMGTNPLLFSYFVDDAYGDDEGNDGLLPQLEGDHGPWRTIQYAIDQIASDAYVEIIVLEGTYAGSQNRDITFDGKAIELRAIGGPENTIIDCDYLGRGFLFSSVDGRYGVVEGFTICNGSAERGGGICCMNGSPTIRNCWLIGNVASYVGGAGETPYDCGGGGIYLSVSGSSLVNCRVIANSVSVESLDDIARCGGGGVYFGSMCSGSATNCVIAGNSVACDAVGVSNQCGGGGLYVGFMITVPSIINSTAVHNEVTITGDSYECGGGALYSYGGRDVPITSCILWSNAAPVGQEIALKQYSLSVSFSDVAGGQAGVALFGGTLTWGEGNLDTDPRFIDEDGADGVPGTDDDDLRLRPYNTNWTWSAVIDAGYDDPFAEEGAVDILGNPRVIDGNEDEVAVVDMGAYEFTIPGDIDSDGDVDISDLGALLPSYGKEEGDPDYNPAADFNGDGIVDLSDMGELLAHYGQSIE